MELSAWVHPPVVRANSGGNLRRGRAGQRGLIPDYAHLLGLVIMTLWGSCFLGATMVRAEDEVCAACDQQVSVSGDFKHRQDHSGIIIQGTNGSAPAFREEINGKNFTVRIALLPAGKYQVTIGEVETQAGSIGERLFDVTSGDVVLGKNYDIISAAGGAGKTVFLSGVVEHDDDAIKGPLAIVFTASKGLAKFNRLTIFN